jgi:UDP-N-acetylglucosamine diphosphorylase/glucosamine-1-phosphate N-acetyltransferase
MKIVLDDNGLHLKFAPLTLTRPLGELRMGIFTNSERWAFLDLGAEISFQTEDYLKPVFGQNEFADVIINAAIIPNEELAAAVFSLAEDEQLFWEDIWVAKKGNGTLKVNYTGERPIVIRERWDLYMLNSNVLKNDFELITNGRISQELSDSNMLIGDPELLFLEEGATVEAAIINTTTGPVYIGKNAEVMEGCIIRGPFALGEEAVLKMGAKVYGATTIGPFCKVGGEISNVLFQSYSNKGHDGFLGNSVIGEWCNLGADTNTSNLKNNYGNVSTYSFESGSEQKTDIQFMGLFMGDHSKCGINTMFNTASVVGVSSNIFGAGFPSKYIPSFSWGGADGIESYRFDKALESINQMMIRRGRSLSEEEIVVLKHISDQQ